MAGGLTPARQYYRFRRQHGKEILPRQSNFRQDWPEVFVLDEVNPCVEHRTILKGFSRRKFYIKNIPTGTVCTIDNRHMWRIVPL